MKYQTKNTRHHGFVLLTVLLMVVLLTALLLNFNYAARTNLHVADSFTSRTQARNCANAGLNIALAAISRNPDIHTNISLRDMFYAPSEFDIAPGHCTVSIEDENGKINVNTLKHRDGRLDRNKIDQLLRLIDLLNQNRRNLNLPLISYSLVPAIIDWTDGDDQVSVLPFVSRQNRGAETSYYENASIPSSCGNRPLQMITELILIKDINAEILFGQPAQDKTRDHLPPMIDYLTVYGSGKINLNTAPPLVIESLSEYINPAIAQTIIDRRKYRPFTDFTQLQQLSGIPAAALAALNKTINIGPDHRYYRIIASGTVNQLSITITAVIRKKSDSHNVEIILYEES